MEEIGDKTTNALIPDKLAAFFKTVGGNLDGVFPTRLHSADLNL